MTISPTALHGPKGRSRQDTHQRLITHSPSDQHQRHISLHLHNHTDSNCPSQHLQDYTLLFGSLLNSTPLFSLVLATSMLSLKLASFPPMPSFSNLSPQQNCCPVSATSPRPKTRNYASLGYTPPPPPGRSNGASPGKIQYCHLPSCPPSIRNACRSFPITFLPFHAETDAGQPLMQNVMGSGARWSCATHFQG